MPVFLYPLAAFLAGSIPFGLLVARAKGVDIRAHGSGNIGATNVLRVVGKPYGIAVFILDFLKGLLPVLALRHYAGPEAVGGIAGVATALCAILGHNYPPWIGFRGGKGIATSAGALLALFPIALTAALLIWVIVFKSTRYVSVASIAAAWAIPVAVAVASARSGEWSAPYLVFAFAVAVLATWRHRSNLRNLRNGTEHRFGTKPSQ